ncbi:phage tail tube protein [Taklimakanibacter deserti]|uniref:phage tail tube protein n=1 Tax=Taklimakanibacter deserti TaxID=2267839 RepID=UPI000E64829F
MSQQTGRLLLIKRGDGGGPEQFTTACGFLARTFAINNNMVDTTTPDCVTPSNKVKESLVYGIQSLQFSGGGKFDNDAVGKAIAAAAFNQTSGNYQVVVPGWGTFEGAFLVENFSFSGEAEGNMDFEATFRLTGAATFTAE